MNETGRLRTAVETWTDLVSVVAAALLAVAPAFLAGEQGVWEVLRVPLGFALVFFLPGYALMAALHPGRDPGDQLRGASDGPVGGSEPSAVERVVLSVGLSVVTVPLVSLVWNFSPQGIGLRQILGSLAAVVAVAAAVAAYRRFRLDAELRFRVPFGRLTADLRAGLKGSTGRQTVLNVFVALLVVVAVVGVGAAVVLPKDGEQYTELYLLSEDPESGDLTANGYPTDFTAGESQELYVGIGNRETETTTYTVVVKLQRLERVDGGRTVVEETALDRFEATVESGQREQIRRTITPSSAVTGDDLRLTFLLYEGPPPSTPTTTNAYREVHIWVDVSSDSVENRDRSAAGSTTEGASELSTDR
jgi:uncharacterized membrane protein